MAVIGCFKDKGNYDYKDAPVLDVEKLLENVNFPSGITNQEYVYELDIPDSLLEIYDFQWESYYEDSLMVYSTGTTLRFTPTEAKRYSMTLVATDKVFKRVSTVENGFSIEVLNNYAGNAFFVLGEADGEVVL